jgi:hypothetical protein
LSTEGVYSKDMGRGNSREGGGELGAADKRLARDESSPALNLEVLSD